MSPNSSISHVSAPRSWRMSKPAAAGTALSLVFAEPEQFPLLDSSVLSPKKPPQLESPHATPSRDAASSLRKASFNDLNNREDAINTPSVRHVDTNFRDRNDEETIKATESSSHSTVTSRDSLQRAGWFSSLSRKRQERTQETIVSEPPMVTEQDTLVAEADLSRSSTNIIPFPASPAPLRSKSDSDSLLPSSNATSAHAPDNLPDSLQASSSTALPTIPPPRSATPPLDKSHLSGGSLRRGHAHQSSIDDTIPTLGSFPDPPASPQPASVRPRTRKDSNLSTLNPSTSRFTLAIPLLGRRKAPLDQAEQAQTTNTESIKVQDSGPELNTSRPISQQLQAEDNSWWNYIGVYSSATVLSSLSQPVSVAMSVEPHTSSVAAEPSLDPPEAPSAPVADTSSAWYVPWAWYGAGPGAGPAQHKTEKTPAELIKEAALARADGPPSESTQQQSSTPTSSLPPSAPSSVNPVVATSETRASWMSFFVSATTSSRAIKEIGEMEVMHVDEDDAQGESGSGVSRNASPTPSINVTPTPSAHNSAVSAHTPSPTKKKPPATQDLPPSHSHSKSAPSIIVSASPRNPNLILPSFDDTFRAPPRSIPVQRGLLGSSTLGHALRWMFSSFSAEEGKGQEKGYSRIRNILPRLWHVLGPREEKNVRRVVVIGIHGWFPGALIRQVVGQPTGTSSKFASMMAASVEAHFGFGALEKITQIVLEGEGTIEQRVTNLYQEYLRHADWVEDMQRADAILVATHSQGSIVSAQLIDRLIREGHIRTQTVSSADAQRVCCLAMCGIHLGPLRYLNTSSLVQPYLQYFESAAARELFEFQDSESQVAKTYIQALNNILEHGTKLVYVASMNDQVVPIYSGSFATATHPLLLRALYIDGDAYSSSDFLSNLLVLLLRIRNAGLDDGGLLTHLSEATAGSLSGVGHSTAYEEPATYRLAVRYLFETSGVLGEHAGRLEVQPFTARAARNDYEIPWALRDLVANAEVSALFGAEFATLRAGFDEWHPRTTILRDLRRKLEPIRRLPTARL